MDKKIARHIAVKSLRLCTELGELLPLLKEHCSPEEYDKYALIIASLSAEVSLQLIFPILKEFPSLNREIESGVETYGKIL
jgi:hypothetical protein